MSTKNTATQDLELGIDAYAGDETSTADLLLNLEGRAVHRFTEGTGKHAGTALMAVELPTGEGLGVQVSMDVDTSQAEVHPIASQQHDGSWVVDPTTEKWTLDSLEEPCPESQIIGVAQKDIMDPDNARVAVILESYLHDSPYALDIHINDSGGTEFFEIEL
ncbi:hypothetical protein [Haloarcula sp. 1CSR25-25]|jgi:hypothetical protein|uniref:hypothetical protein n=1 Tax=Haloarcula sp. 1CSR25-25 TaxID=2862545 RepID=UPI002895E762|nr:hypothetical protein [Haloarcula sp. 1CSR25-25]MDT3437816.1 hypothetical protein [Haloarcula sp. 1CSR25-25]